MFFKKIPQIPSLSPLARAFDLVTSTFSALSSDSVVFLYQNVEQKELHNKDL